MSHKDDKEIEMIYMGRRQGSNGKIYHLFLHEKHECHYLSIRGCVVGHVYIGVLRKGPKGERQQRMFKRPDHLRLADEVPEATREKWEAADLVVKGVLDKRNAARRFKENKLLDPFIDQLATLIGPELNYHEAAGAIEAVFARAWDRARKKRNTK